jgi:hypothetical protein
MRIIEIFYKATKNTKEMLCELVPLWNKKYETNNSFEISYF